MRAAIEDTMKSNSTEGDQILLEEFSDCKSYLTSHKLILHISGLWKPLKYTYGGSFSGRLADLEQQHWHRKEGGKEI